jgi:hypothetical protein
MRIERSKFALERRDDNSQESHPVTMLRRKLAAILPRRLAYHRGLSREGAERVAARRTDGGEARAIGGQLDAAVRRNRRRTIDYDLVHGVRWSRGV